jgi:hypothetical protein
MHLANQEVYRAAWEIVVEGREPQDENEKKIYESMKDKDVYFSKFPDKESYVNYSTAYWNFAYVDAESGWIDINETDEYNWINNFYQRFVSRLRPDDTISIYECTINSDDDD